MKVEGWISLRLQPGMALGYLGTLTVFETREAAESRGFPVCYAEFEVPDFGGPGKRVETIGPKADRTRPK